MGPQHALEPSTDTLGIAGYMRELSVASRTVRSYRPGSGGGLYTHAVDTCVHPRRLQSSH